MLNRLAPSRPSLALPSSSLAKWPGHSSLDITIKRRASLVLRPSNVLAQVLSATRFGITLSQFIVNLKDMDAQLYSS